MLLYAITVTALSLSHFDIALSKNYLFYLLFELFFPSHERLEFNDKSAY